MNKKEKIFDEEWFCRKFIRWLFKWKTSRRKTSIGWIISTLIIWILKMYEKEYKELIRHEEETFTRVPLNKKDKIRFYLKLC